MLIGRQLTKTQWLKMTVLFVISHRVDEAGIGLGVIWLGDWLRVSHEVAVKYSCAFSHLGIRPCLLLAGQQTFHRVTEVLSWCGG